jgi:flagellar biosynthesis/type III secretory pathway protein FliH
MSRAQRKNRVREGFEEGFEEGVEEGFGDDMRGDGGSITVWLG